MSLTKQRAREDNFLPKVSSKKIDGILHDPEKTAKAVNLVYVTDDTPGITREKRRNKFRYFLEGKEVKNAGVLDRIRKLVIPPAWKDVWICPSEKGHLQATGKDAKNRKQYLYHPSWVELRNHTKYYRMVQFAYGLPRIRAKIEKDLARHGLPQEKVLAAVVSLMEHTSMRVGNSSYEKRCISRHQPAQFKAGAHCPTMQGNSRQGVVPILR